MPKTTKTRPAAKSSASTARKRSTAPAKGKRTTTRAAKTSAPQASAAGGILGVAGAMQGAPRHLLIFLPGFPGSELIDPKTKEKVWVDFSATNVFINHNGPVDLVNNMFAKMQFPHPDPTFKLEVGGPVENVFGGLPIELQYSRIRAFLKGLQYEINPDPGTDPDLICYFFGYDWRQDHRISARNLKAQIAIWQAMHPGREIWLMGHSGGGIVSRWYINQEGGDTVVKRVFLLASPWDGSLAILDVLLNGMKVPFDLDALAGHDLSIPTRDALRTFPGAYQIIPHQRHFLYDAQGQVVDPFIGENWLDPEKHDQILMLQDAKAFHQTMGNTIRTDNVEVLAFIGYNQPTRTVGRVTFKDGNRWDRVTWASPLTLGDGTVPQYSAEYNDAKRIFSYMAAHSDIYDHERVKARLTYELKTKFEGVPEPVLGVQPAAVAAQADLLDDENRDLRVEIQYPLKIWTPGQPIDLRVTVQNINTGEPVTNASVSATLIFNQQLLGAPEVAIPAPTDPIVLEQDVPVAGLYQETIHAPMQEGYYDLETTVSVPGESRIIRKNKFTVKAATQ